MAHSAGRPVTRIQARPAGITPSGARPGGRRHPLVATAMALPPALLLAVLFGGTEAVATQASSVAGLLGLR